MKLGTNSVFGFGHHFCGTYDTKLLLSGFILSLTRSETVRDVFTKSTIEIKNNYSKTVASVLRTGIC